MRRLKLRRIVITVAIIASASAVLVSAGPIMNIQNNELSNELRSLAGLEKVSIRLYPLPSELVEAGVRSAQILGDLRNAIEQDAGLTIDKDEAEAQVVFKVMSTSHGGSRGVVGFVIFIGVRQDVIVDRLDGDPMRLQTMLHSKLAIVPERSVATRFTTEARIAAEEFATLVITAKRQKAAPINR